ncbi:MULTISPECIES: MFS transporter [Pseudomonas]|jgi:MHS family proline/betaine transporter-like MFS transporter|uniref:MFS transporter n=1 Tax=Pseudomonas TaxID=286 RepID=UPI00041DE1F3|nr:MULTISPECIES: MFS transporter [Pseudomonas]KAA6172311.1 MFS transporter [Pseudomonas marginalis]MBU0939456.1 MFS transporter [Gammaproteobacteria bacterium]MBF8005076.1 MFS transporter [Pseudomonas brenneri]WJM92055.1 MFS transporter [Pseudomonas brenneri]CRM35523.1 Proline porter II [Pseudomonas sp. 25 R 14]
MTVPSSVLSSAQAPTQRGPWKEIIAASVGNALEFYDLLIYGYFAVVISKQFFPSDNETTSLLLAVGSFGISFLMRPLGAIVLGSYTDRAGRKASLTMSIMIMLIGTAMITFAPTYEQIGLAAPLLIIVARMLQGFSTGGEFGAATAFMVEHADAKRRGFFASWQLSTQGLATVLAAGVSAILSYALSDVQLNDWGWRVAFGFGLLIGPVGFYIRTQIDETPDFKKTVASTVVRTPLRDVLIKGHVSLLLAIGVVAGATAFNYVHKLYMPIYALKQLNITATSSYLGALMTGITLMLMAPIFGGLSDRHGRFRVLTIALLITGFSSYPMFVLLNTFPSFTTLLIVQAIVGVLIAACLGPIPAMLADIFPTSIRGTGLALSYNFSVTLFGGFAPLIVTWMIDATGSKLAPSFYVMATILISVLAIVCLGRRMRGTHPAAN